MVVRSHSIAVWKNALVSAFNWILLAGFVVFPGTFASLSRVGVLGGIQPGSALQHAFRNTSLLCLAVICSVVGILGISILWWNVRHNFIWITSRILL